MASSNKTAAVQQAFVRLFEKAAACFGHNFTLCDPTSLQLSKC